MAAHFDLEAELIAQGLGPVAGIDEVGRGPLAGPVCVAAVILDPNDPPAGIDDSKQLTARRREALYEEICARALAISVALGPAAEIDALNIRGATLTCMSRAARGLILAPRFALVDGRDLPDLPCPGRAVIAGDAISLSIAAASIVAKVTRDRLMARLDTFHRGYGFAAHAGYPTPMHKAALKSLGPCGAHRRSFAPVRKALGLCEQ
ncbi:ribonuclease HII [Rhodoblastus acidophilus]|uniref:Ribonuclease HII n=1 Tax=Candidatus Rhodoblastus alkanivorans TaxID=2954117 RepID=A0ABS9Z9K5_9HYPH|nr:ribonuclease HII [Candidatus Rhodoblastus alkanivorans]MCI4679777.1 ribonuclease HII [Candidatus Rhodoblastus alkanivorans]MCI4684303.1 ribonuclease HII [Candidatus Rhodoblastus alkanivorans]MDI4641624.1 ribonuclease HII [Rhodoblastus acidophilus]